MRHPSSTSCFKFGIRFFDQTPLVPKQGQNKSFLDFKSVFQCRWSAFSKNQLKKGFCFATSRPLDPRLTSLPGLGRCPVRQQNHQRDLPQPQPDRWRGNEGLVGGASRGSCVRVDGSGSINGSDGKSVTAFDQRF